MPDFWHFFIKMINQPQKIKLKLTRIGGIYV